MRQLLHIPDWTDILNTVIAHAQVGHFPEPFQRRDVRNIVIADIQLFHVLHIGYDTDICNIIVADIKYSQSLQVFKHVDVGDLVAFQIQELQAVKRCQRLHLADLIALQMQFFQMLHLTEFTHICYFVIGKIQLFELGKTGQSGQIRYITVFVSLVGKVQDFHFRGFFLCDRSSRDAHCTADLLLQCRILKFDRRGLALVFIMVCVLRRLLILTLVICDRTLRTQEHIHCS